MFRRILCRGICLPLVFPSETLFRRRQKDRERVREPRTFADMSLLRVCAVMSLFMSLVLVRTCTFHSCADMSLLQSCADMFTFPVLCGHVHFCSLVRTCSLLQSCADMFTLRSCSCTLCVFGAFGSRTRPQLFSRREIHAATRERAHFLHANFALNQCTLSL